MSRPADNVVKIKSQIYKDPTANPWESPTVTITEKNLRGDEVEAFNFFRQSVDVSGSIVVVGAIGDDDLGGWTTATQTKI